MKVHKIAYITISALSLTFLILTLQKIEFNKNNELRHLSLDETKVDEICKKGPEKVSNYYLNADAKIQPADTSRYYGDHVDILIELIDGKTDNLISYVMRLLPFVVFIIFSIFSIFGWIFCCCCCCCPCCCCNQTKKNQYLCRLVSFIVAMTLFALIVGLSSYGFFGLNNIMKGVNGMSCTVFKLYLELINGQSIDKIPKWSGINGIFDTLHDIKGTVNKIVEDKDQIFKEKDTFNQQKKDFQDDLKTAKYTTEIDALKIEYNEPQTTSNKVQITPDYVTLYKPVETKDTSLYLINYEFETVVSEADKLLTDASNQADSIVSSADIVTSSIDSINSIIADFNTNLEDFSKSVAEPWMDYQDMITNYGTLACNCFFGVLAGFGLVVIILTSIFVVCRIKCTKIFIIIIWNILALVMILSFIIGAIFGILGVIGKDGTSVIYFLISAENLQSESPKIIPSSISSKINICLHDNGDLSSEFDTSSMNNLTELDKIKEQLDIARGNLAQHKNSITISNLNTKLDEIKINFDDASKTTQNLSNLLNSLNDKTNTGKNCGSIQLYDKWVINKDDCDRTNPYAENRGQLGNRNCLIFSDKAADLNRYNSCTPPNEITKYIEAIHEYKESNIKCIDEIKKRNNDLNTRFTGVIDQLISTINDVEEKLLNKVSELSNSINGNSEGNIINTLVNCGFLQGHVRMVYENLYDGLGSNFYTFGIIMEVISLSIALGICFLIPVLNRFNKTYPEDIKEINEEDKSPLKPIVNKEAAPSGAFTEPEIIQINKKGVKTQQKCLEKGKVIVKRINYN